MTFAGTPIRRKILSAIMLTSATVLIVTVLGFMIYDTVTFRRAMARNLATLARVIASNSSAALAFKNEKDAREILSSLRVEPHVTSAALYDTQGKVFVRYPADAAENVFSGALPKLESSRFERSRLVFFEPVTQNGARLGTLCLASDLKALHDRLRLYASLAGILVLGSIGVTFLLSNWLQKRITGPILALVATARAISARRDYSVRAPKFSDDELGLLTDAFNQMLARIQEQTVASAFLAAIVESSDDAIIGKDLSGKVVSWNTAAERMFGYPAAEMVGQSIERVISSDRPDEERRVLEQAKCGETRRYETVRVRKDGQPIHLSLTISPIRNPAGTIVGVSSIARDITERIQAREALERQARVLREQAQMLDLANVMARDPDGRIILWNSGMEKMYGWSRAEVMGRNLREVLQTRFSQSPEEIQATLLREGRWEGELVHTRKDGQRLTVTSQWVLHKDDQGRPAAVLEVNTDITERKQAEEQIRRLNAELEQRVQERTAELTEVNKELEGFTYSVAHDLRAPLRHIDAFTRIVSEDFSAALPPEARRYLEIIRKGSQNMSRLVDDLLNLARVGRQELKRQLTPLNPMVADVVAEMKGETENRRIEWHINQLPAVEGDPGLMKQVFANLLSNAVKYTRPRGTAVIEIGQRQIGGETVIYVRDNGVGFNMKYAHKLFGVFQRLHRMEEFEGTGVGLAIVERVIRRHGGRIWAESEENHGATFYFTLDGLDKTRKSGSISKP